MDRHSQTGSNHPPDEHQVDLNVRAIVLSGALLALGIAITFVLAKGVVWGLEKWEKSQEAPLSPVQRQLEAQRGYTEATPRENQNVGEKKGSIKPSSEEVQRIRTEQRVEKTFATPRLQYDDAQEMNLFLSSENELLNSSGKNADGSVHIPISQAMQLLVQRGLPQVSGKFSPEAPVAVPTIGSRGSSHQPKAERGLAGEIKHPKH
jgi:hypothetical protein